MKTAMQELIEFIEKHNFCTDDTDLNKAKSLLEKEKEQMLSFGLYVKQNGWVGCKIEDMYEDYFNQNK